MGRKIDWDRVVVDDEYREKITKRVIKEIHWKQDPKSETLLGKIITKIMF